MELHSNTSPDTNHSAEAVASCPAQAALRPACCPLEAHRAQFLMLAHSIRPDLAVMLATIIFDGGAR